jgi:dsRNA-specific ribonuclease
MTPPAWVKQADSDRARLNFLVRLAALYASPKGTLSELAKMCGYNPRAMSTYAALETGRATVSPALAKAIEAACGGVVTRAQLNSVFED